MDRMDRMIGVCVWMQGLRWQKIGVLGWAIAVGLLLWGCPQPTVVCKEDKDCASGQQCTGGSCKVTAEAGQEKTTGEKSNPEEGGPQDGAEEPPPLPDVVWGEGSLPRPEGFADGKIPEAPQGVGRKAGETCDPSLTGRFEDRCIQGHLCAAPDLGPVGICQPACDPKGAACPADQACGPVMQPLTLALLGYACAKGVEDGYPCTFGFPCKAGSICVPYGGDTKGVCQKKCEKAADCVKNPGDKGICGGSKDIADPSKTVTTCLEPVGVGELCEGPKACLQGMRCLGSPPRCLEECTANGTCPADKVCVPTKDADGKVLYAACYPTRQEGDLCSSITRCPDGQVCATYSQGFSACVKDCTKDPSLCTSGESCESLSTTRKICVKKELQQGEICEGPRRCAPDLSCIVTRAGEPRTCHLSCKGDPAKCAQGQVCQPLAEGDAAAICAPGCDPQAPCTAPGTKCITLAGKTSCLPDTPTQRPGTAKRTEACLQNPAAPADQRCGVGLRCTALADGTFCLLPCDPVGGEACPASEACVYESNLKGHFCGVAQGAGVPCDLRFSKLCSPDQICLLRRFESKGTCSLDPRIGGGGLCLDIYAPCEENFRCGGEPLTPFRWRCRGLCSQAPSVCEPTEGCLNLGQGKACFPLCSPAQTCTPAGLVCQEIQSQSVCL